jgi:hypothetical protein
VNLKPHKALKPGRYALDRDGRLHPLRRRYWVDVVAIVHVKPLGAARCPAPEPVELVECGVCVPPVAVPARPAKLPIDLSQVPSSMELRAASWKGKP